MNAPAPTNNDVTPSERPALSAAQMRDAARALYVGRRNWIEICSAGKGERRPPEWFIEQRNVLEEIRQIGTELSLIADNAESYERWKATLTPQGTGQK